jgi:hypothetical protein
VHDSDFSNNKVRPLMIGDKAEVVLHASNVSNNVVGSDWGGGIWVEGNASVTMVEYGWRATQLVLVEGCIRKMVPVSPLLVAAV